MVFGPFFATFIALTKVIRYFTGSDSDQSVSTPEAKSVYQISVSTPEDKSLHQISVSTPEDKSLHRISVSTPEDKSLHRISVSTPEAKSLKQTQEQANCLSRPTPKRKCRKRRQLKHSGPGARDRKRANHGVPAISDLQFVKVLGQGAFGQVFLCENPVTNLQYAVKKVTEPDMTTIKKEKNVLRLGSTVWSHFITKLCEEFMNEEPEFIVMEYMPGGDLLTDLNNHNQQYTEPKARFYTAEIICGLEFLHLYGIVHRDLKLDNVLLTQTGHIKIADFGNAYQGKRMFEKIDQQGVIYGTPMYTAPEVILQHPYDSCCDWWALGVMLFMMLTGSMPFYGNSRDELFYNITNEDPEEPDSYVLSLLSVDAFDLFLHLLEKDPMLRIGYKGGQFPWIKDHALFKGLNWDDLAALKMDPP